MNEMNEMKRQRPYGGKICFVAQNGLQNKFQGAKRRFLGSLTFILFINTARLAGLMNEMNVNEVLFFNGSYMPSIEMTGRRPLFYEVWTSSKFINCQ